MSSLQREIWNFFRFLQTFPEDTKFLKYRVKDIKILHDMQYVVTYVHYRGPGVVVQKGNVEAGEGGGPGGRGHAQLQASSGEGAGQVDLQLVMRCN